MKISIIILLLLSGNLFVYAGDSQSKINNAIFPEEMVSLSKVNPLERAKLHPIISRRPAVEFFQGAVLGNGGLGVIVNTRPDAVVLRFGHNDVWDIRIAEDNKDKLGTFKEIFEKVKAIPATLNRLEDDPWYDEYIKLMQENYRKPYPRPFPCGSIILWFDRRTAELLGHRLNIESGICEVYFLIDNEIKTLEIFVDQTQDRLWMRMVDDSGLPVPAPFVYITLLPDSKTPKELPKYSASKLEEESSLSFRQILPFEEITDTKPYVENPQDRAFRLTARLNAKIYSGTAGTSRQNPEVGQWIPSQNPDSGPLRAMIDKSSEFIMCAQVEQGLASSISNNSGELPVPLRKTYQMVSEVSKKEWEKYWEKSGVTIDDEILERTWYRNLYFLKCSTRPGATCPGLFANWSYQNIGTAWHGDYHMNYNVQQPFWVTFSTNHVDLNLPYVDLIDHLLPVSKKWAQEYYKLRGAFFPHSTYPVEMTTNPYPVPHWGWEVFETPWAVQSLWWHYIYTMDTNFLKERAFTPIQEAVLFLVDYMHRPEAHGEQWGDDNYHIFPSVPPELYGLRPGFDKNYDTVADLTLTRFVFKAFLESCKILGCEESEADLIRDIKDILNHFPEYPTAQSQRGKVFVAVKGEDPEVVYNCPASLMSVFPGEDHGLHSSSEEYKIAETTYRNQQNEGGNDLVFLNIQAARLGILDIEKFKRQIEYCLLPNGTCTDMVLQIHGRYTNNTPFDFMAPMGIWYENFSLPFVINECMMQSYNGELRFFPNWQQNKTAEFRSLRTVGAFLINARWSQGRVQWIEILSEAGKTLNIISPWKGGVICKSSIGERQFSGDRFTIETKVGEFLQLLPKSK